MTVENLLEVAGLSTRFKAFEGDVLAVQNVSFELREGEILALVGESGCGKSVTARSVMGLYSGSHVVLEGSIKFKGQELSKLSPDERATFRGRDMAMIFQEPMSAFDPLATVGEQMIDAKLAHVSAAGKKERAEARKFAVEALRSVGIPDPEMRIDEYPHRLSGGMLQRVLIAIALMNEPELLIADEPTTALDVTIQAQVLRLIRDLKQKNEMGVLFITHDLGVVAELADRVHVMYAGRIVEKATVAEIFSDEGPLHPYARGLLESRVRRDLKGRELPSIPGSVPRPVDLPPGCHFAPRCPKAGPRCLREAPELVAVGNSGRAAACWLYQGGVQ